MVTPQTLGMYYYGFSKLSKREDDIVEQNSPLFDSICHYLTKKEIDEDALKDDIEEQADGDYDFSAGLQVTGLITYSS